MIDRILDKITDLAAFLVRKILRDKAPKALKERDSLAEIVNYLIFGVLTTLVSLVTYALLSVILNNAAFEKGTAELTWRANTCQIFSWICAVLFAFFTNRTWVFRSQTGKNGLLPELGKFILARVAGLLVIELGIFNLLLLFLPDFVSKLIVTVLVIIFNYFASKFAVFTGGKKASPESSKPEV